MANYRSQAGSFLVIVLLFHKGGYEGLVDVAVLLAEIDNDWIRDPN